MCIRYSGPLRPATDRLPEQFQKRLTGADGTGEAVLPEAQFERNAQGVEDLGYTHILASDHVIRQAHLVNIIEPASPQIDVDVPRTGDELKRIKKVAREKSVETIEKLFVLEALKRNAWNVTRSAEETGMQRPNFQALMKKYNIRVRDTEQSHGSDGG